MPDYGDGTRGSIALKEYETILPEGGNLFRIFFRSLRAGFRQLFNPRNWPRDRPWDNMFR